MSQNSFFQPENVTAIASGEAKNRFGEVLDLAQRAPVRIEKHGRPVVYIVAAADFDLLAQAAQSV